LCYQALPQLRWMMCLLRWDDRIQGWKLQDIQIALTDLANNPQKLTLTIKKLSLPKPFDDLNLVNIHCSPSHGKTRSCCVNKGVQTCAQSVGNHQRPIFFYHREKLSTLKLTDLQLLMGSIRRNGRKGQSMADTD